MASVASPSTVCSNLTRSLSKACGSQSFEDSMTDSVLDIFGNSLFTGFDDENVDQSFLPSWYCVSESETRLRGEGQTSDQKFVSSDPVGLVPTNAPFNKQSAQEGEKLVEQPNVTSYIQCKNGITDSQISPKGKGESTITPSSKPMGARPKEFTHIEGRTRSKPCDLEKMEKEHCAERSFASQETSNAKRNKKKSKIRTKSTKKWKPLDIAEFGFDFSRVNKLDFDEDKKCEESGFAAPVPDVDQIPCNSSKEDAEFFLSLGFDVYADYDDSYRDNIADWDGVKLLNKNLQPTNVLPSRLTIIKTNAPETVIKVKSRVKEVRPAPPGQGKTTEAKSKLVSNCQLDTVIRKCDKYSLFELECSSRTKLYIRRDKHRRVEKAHRAVKSKNCVSIFNNRGRKRLYMHHRLVKMHGLSSCMDFRSFARCMPAPPRPKNKVDLDVAKQIFKVNHNSDRPAGTRQAPVQNLRHTLHESNAPNHLDLDLASFLISLQHREMTPEDYEMLLRLDDTVKPKTVSENILDKLHTATVGPEGVGNGEEVVPCAICMEPYVPGDKRKFLPCNHDFHACCVDTWLKNSSMNCPLDGLPVMSS